MNLPDKPSWEVVITTSQNKRNKELMSIHVGLFNTLWQDIGSDQVGPENYFIKEVTQQSDSHKHAVASAAEWLWCVLESSNLKMLRFASGKYLDDKLAPFYDEYVDLDVSLVLEEGRAEVIVVLIDRMVNYNRGYIKFIGEQNENSKLEI